MIFIGLGSSIGNAEEIFRSTEKFLNKNNITIKKKSNIFKNPPFGNIAKNEFSNAVWEIFVEKNITPFYLLKILKNCEKYHGRDFTKPLWSDRILDIDILFFNNQKINTKNLKIPHPGIKKRIFVIKPWCEILEKNFEIKDVGITLLKT